MVKTTQLNTDEIIDLALAEDLPNGDITTDGLGLSEKIGCCHLVAKQDLVLSGSQLFSATVAKLDASCELSFKFKDGDLVAANSVVCELKGNLLQLLKAERVALNLLGHLSGIATLTKAFVQAAANIKILDTRKTLPLYRGLQKQAVIDGGGNNHRMNLSDAILIKENHICAAGSLQAAIDSIKQAQPGVFVEVEVKDLEEVQLAVELGAQRLLLDNMNNEQLRECLKVIPKQVETEASGNMTVERVRSLNGLDLDYVSVGALTHSAANADFSLLFQWQ